MQKRKVPGDSLVGVPLLGTCRPLRYCFLSHLRSASLGWGPSWAPLLRGRSKEHVGHARHGRQELHAGNRRTRLVRYQVRHVLPLLPRRSHEGLRRCQLDELPRARVHINGPHLHGVGAREERQRLPHVLRLHGGSRQKSCQCRPTRGGGNLRGWKRRGVRHSRRQWRNRRRVRWPA